MVQWTKNLTAEARVPVEVKIRSLTQHKWVKGSGVGSTYSLDSIPGLGTSICHGCSHKKKVYRSKKISRTQQGKIHNVWHPKITGHAKKQENMS